MKKIFYILGLALMLNVSTGFAAGNVLCQNQPSDSDACKQAAREAYEYLLQGAESGQKRAYQDAGKPFDQTSSDVAKQMGEVISYDDMYEIVRVCGEKYQTEDKAATCLLASGLQKVHGINIPNNKLEDIFQKCTDQHKDPQEAALCIQLDVLSEVQKSM